MDELTSLTEVKGIGEKTAAVFAKKGLLTAGDLLQYYPRGYEHYEPPVKAEELIAGRTMAVRLTILGRGTTAGRGSYRVTSFRAADPTGNVRIAYFNMPYMASALKAGATKIFRGLVKVYGNGSVELQQPAGYTEEEYAELENRMLPVYPLTKDLKNGQVVRTMKKVLASFQFPEDYLSPEMREELGLAGYAEAVRGIHFPASEEEMVRARNRLVFDEFFYFILGLRRNKGEDRLPNPHPFRPTPATEAFLEKLPFSLTPSQQKAWKEIEADLCSDTLMNRLLQGDVGSGKTIIAFLALLLAAENGFQGALMAPTEVLANQHMEGLSSMAEKYGLSLKPVLLTGSVKGKARREALASIADGSANVIIGTHALIQEAVNYKALGLVITDEQHRFGVRQREALAGKGSHVPVLVMSATPIPRTLSIILYGDLSVSLLTELPAGRQPIKNLAMSAENRGKALAFVLREIRKGRQAYIICPAVEAMDEEAMMAIGMDNGELSNVTDYAKSLQASVPEGVRVQMLHGRMKSGEKDEIMRAFAAGEIDILVSTTVIEVGINVPNATVILVENAERFGLSQLHQLRGRVGRGSEQSYCIFLYSEGIAEKPKRLAILEKSNDGFFVAEEDLKLRGPGDLFGVRQSGQMGFVLADIYEDAGLMQKAAAHVDTVLAQNPDFVPRVTKTVDFRSI